MVANFPYISEELLIFGRIVFGMLKNLYKKENINYQYVLQHGHQTLLNHITFFITTLINNIEKNSGLGLHKMSQRRRDRNEWRAVVMSAGDPIDEHGDGYK